MLFSRASAAWTAAVEPPGMGSWRTGKRVSLSQTELLRIKCMILFGGLNSHDGEPKAIKPTDTFK